MILISAVIITHNEERNIARCINSLKNVADEIIVVDSHSTDNTVSIAKSLGAKTILREFKGYGEQKYFAVLQTSNDWVLSLDADESLSPTLQKSILKVKQNPTFGAYKINILTNYCGHWIHHCGWYPQPKIRFWNKHKGHMNRSTVHEEWCFSDKETKPGRLKGDILHYSFNTISDHIRKLEHYTELMAKAAVAQGRRVNLFEIWFAPKWRFFVDYFLRAGFLDGYYGYIVCKNSAFYTYTKYIKIWQYSKINSVR